MRRLLKDQEVGLDVHFRYRGKNQTRVETLSDASFALAITLLVLSSSVPETYVALQQSLWDIVPFGICVTLIMLIWYQHYIFFLKYGLQDKAVILINTFLIFLLLIYVYPLKFLFKVIFQIYVGLISGDTVALNHLFSEVIPLEDTPGLMALYGFGAALIFSTMALFYRYALKHKKELELSVYEIFETKTGLYLNLFLALVPFLSGCIALFGLFGRHTFAAAGFAYFLYPIIMPAFGVYRGKRSQKVLANSK
jgi:uncharacterized membrane protein